MAVVHTDLYIGSLSILDMGQADKSCFPLVSQTESFLICPLRPCHAFCESFEHDKSYENVFLEEGQSVVFSFIKTVKIPSNIYCCYCVQNKAKKTRNIEVL